MLRWILRSGTFGQHCALRMQPIACSSCEKGAAAGVAPAAIALCSARLSGDRRDVHLMLLPRHGARLLLFSTLRRDEVTTRMFHVSFAKSHDMHPLLLGHDLDILRRRKALRLSIGGSHRRLFIWIFRGARFVAYGRMPHRRRVPCFVSNGPVLLAADWS